MKIHCTWVGLLEGSPLYSNKGIPALAHSYTHGSLKHKRVHRAALGKPYLTISNATVATSV